MSIEITFLGHAGFMITDGTHVVAIDPFLTGNPVATVNPEDIHCQYITLTHGHADHMGDTVMIAKANCATVIAAFEITEYLGDQGIQNTEPANPGGKVQTEFGWVAFTQAVHSSSYNGQYMGVACGVVVNMGGITVYHCGDTDLFSDMKLIGEIYQPDIACIPVGDRLTMGPELATLAAELIRPTVAIPIHYGTWPLLVQNISAFRPKGITVQTLKPGERWSFG